MKFLLFLLVFAAADRGVVRRAVYYAEQRIKQKDSWCHGTLQNNISADIYMSFAKRRAVEQEEHDDHSLHTLYEWCKADEQCCKSYFLRGCGESNAEYSDFEMFRYLTSRWHDKNYPLTQILDEGGLCGSATPSLQSRSITAVANAAADGDHVLDRMLRKAWVLEMRLQTCERGQVHCAENQKFIYSPQDAEGRCVCSEADDDCHAAYRKQHVDPWTWSTTALVTAAVAVFILVVLDIYKSCLQIMLFREMIARMRRTSKVDKEATQKDVDSFVDALQIELAKK